MKLMKNVLWFLLGKFIRTLEIETLGNSHFSYSDATLIIKTLIIK